MLQESESLQTNPVYVTMSKESIPRRASASSELSAVSLKIASKTSECQQQQIPLDEMDADKKESPEQYNLTIGFDEINENNSNTNNEVSVLTYVRNSKGTYVFLAKSYYICTWEILHVNKMLALHTK